MIFSSDPQNGAVVTNKGSTAVISLENPLRIPSTAFHATLTCRKSSIWYNQPNIITGENDSFEITAPAQVEFPAGSEIFVDGNLQTSKITLPEGLYDIDQLNASIEKQLRSLGFDRAPGEGGADNTQTVLFEGDSATGKTILIINHLHTTVNFNVESSIGPLLGFLQTDVFSTELTSVQDLITLGYDPANGTQVDFLAETISITNFSAFPFPLGQWVVGDFFRRLDASGVSYPSLEASQWRILEVVTDTTGQLTLRVDRGPNPTIVSPGPLGQFIFARARGDTTLPVEFASENQATLNQIDNYYIHCDLVNYGLGLNSAHRQIIQQVQITADPGNLNTYEPQHPLALDARHLIGQTRRVVQAYITDQAGNRIDTKGKSWSFIFRISYLVTS